MNNVYSLTYWIGKKSEGKLDVKHSSSAGWGGGQKVRSSKPSSVSNQEPCASFTGKNICVARCAELLVAVMNEWDVDEEEKRSGESNLLLLPPPSPPTPAIEMPQYALEGKVAFVPPGVYGLIKWSVIPRLCLHFIFITAAFWYWTRTVVHSATLWGLPRNL